MLDVIFQPTKNEGNIYVSLHITWVVVIWSVLTERGAYSFTVWMKVTDEQRHISTTISRTIVNNLTASNTFTYTSSFCSGYFVWKCPYLCLCFLIAPISGGHRSRFLMHKSTASVVGSLIIHLKAFWENFSYVLTCLWWKPVFLMHYASLT